jgi:hypothetical protein
MTTSTASTQARGRARLGLALATIAVAAVGCGDDESPTAPVSQTSLRVIHLSPDAPLVDVYLNRQATPAVSALGFGSGTAYLATAPGTYDVDVAPAGTSIAQSVLSVNGLGLEAGAYYTAVAFDRVASIDPLALADDFSNLASGNIRVRAIHTAAAVGQVDIWNIPATGAPAPLYENVDFGVAGGYLDLPAGAYTLGFDVDDDANPDVVFRLPALPAGTVANVFAVSDADDNVYLMAQLQDSQLVLVDPS